MKKIMILLLALLMVVPAHAALSIPNLQTSLLNQDPDPAGPGSYVDLRFKIQNTGESAAEKVLVELLPSYPFSLDYSETAERDLGIIPATGDGSQVVIVKYKVRIDQNAVEGENTINLRYKVGNGEWISEEFNINIRTLDSTLSVESVETEPELIVPGQTNKVKVTLTNIADSVIKDVTFKLDLTYSTILSQVTTLDPLAGYSALPFAPVNSATEKKVRFINPGKSHVFEYDIIADSDAESRVYKVPIEITYYDELDNKYTKNDIIGLIVGTPPDLSVVVDSTDLTLGKKVGTVTLRVINKGFTDVKFLDLWVESNGVYELLSAPEVYIGNVNSDDYETAEFDVHITKDYDLKTVQNDTIMLPVKLQYRDANGELYDENIELGLTIHNPSKLGETKNNTTKYIIIGLIAVVLIWFFFFRKKKK